VNFTSQTSAAPGLATGLNSRWTDIFRGCKVEAAPPRLPDDEMFVFSLEIAADKCLLRKSNENRETR
jgi:hypothetical protein